MTAPDLALAAAAGFVGGAMNALAGGGTFATLPSLLALGLPANIANATERRAVARRGDERLGVSRRTRRRRRGRHPAAGGDHLRRRIGRQRAARADPEPGIRSHHPWLVLFALVVLAFGKRAAAWLHAA